ncbi:MAG: C25 family cysteine peptidase, partial [bacterium]|nr:C25 family cysteine peptidase [bacterium]
MKKLLSLLGILFLSIPALGGELIIEKVSFSKAGLSFGKFNGYDVVKLKDGISTGEAGSPMLPCYQVRILIPTTATASGIEVISVDKEILPGKYTICPTQPPRPISINKEIPFVGPNPDVYSSYSHYPGKLTEFVGTGSKGGYRIAEILVYPVQYIPAERTLIFYSNIVLKLKYETTHIMSEITKFQKQSMERIIRSLVINPEDIDIYAPLVKDRQDEISYCIITSSDFAPEFQSLADWKTKKGVRARVVKLDSIYANCSGSDNQIKIRNFIKDAYSNWGTIYFLLGGQCDYENNQEVVPRRDVFCMDPGVGYYPDEEWEPCDLYYSDTNGTWDGNNNGIYGEMTDNVDIYADVFVGRAPARNLTQVETFINKVLTYEKNPPTGYQKKILLAALRLFYGYTGDIISDSIAAVTPASWLDAILSEAQGTISRQIVIDSLNAGFGFAHYAAHGNEYGVYSGQGAAILTSSDVDGLHNGGRLGIHNAISCFCGAVDEVAGGDCFAEHFINNPNGGGIASIMNSRYGYGTPPELGPSECIDLAFYKKLFNDGLYHLGEAHAASKDAYVTASQSGQWPEYWRYCLYELNLFGDPELPMWTDEPKSLAVEHLPTIPVGQTWFEVTVSSDNVPVKSALVCVMKEEDNVYAIGYTNENGVATMNLPTPPTSIGTLYATVTAHNFLPYEGNIQVVPAAIVTINPDTIQVNTLTPVEITVLDTLNQGIADVVTKIYGLGVSLCDTTNAAGQCVINVTAPYGEVLKCTGREIGVSWDMFIDSIWVIGWDTLLSPDISAQVTELGMVDTLTPYYEGTITARTGGDSGFTLFTKGCGVDTSVFTIGTIANLGVVPTSLGNLWGYIAKRGYRIYKESFPVIQVFGTLVGTVTDLSNDNPIPGVRIKGYVAGDTTTPVFAVVSDTNGNYSTTQIPVGNYDIYASRLGYSPYSTTLFLKYGANTFDIKLQCILTPGFSDSLEPANAGWTHYQVTSGYKDEWHIETYRSHSPTHSWKCGGAGSASYSNRD